MRSLLRAALTGAVLLAAPSAARATVFQIDHLKIDRGEYKLVGGHLKQDVEWNATFGDLSEDECYRSTDVHTGETHVDYVAEKQRDVIDVTKSRLRLRHPLVFSGDITQRFSRTWTNKVDVTDTTHCDPPPPAPPISTSKCGHYEVERVKSIALTALTTGKHPEYGPFGPFVSSKKDPFGIDCPSDDTYGTLTLTSPDLSAHKEGDDKIRLTGSATSVDPKDVGGVGSAPLSARSHAKITWALVLRKQG